MGGRDRVAATARRSRDPICGDGKKMRNQATRKRSDTRELHEDPLHGFMVGLKMFAELMADLPNGHPGCLVASYCYQDQPFNQEIRDLNAEAVLAWRRRLRSRFDLIVERYPPRIDVDLDVLSDMVSALVDGGLILSKVVKDKDVLPRQILVFREFVRATFLGA
jgi:TetR/AcrR family transcriptional repressor of nem operon